MYIHVVYVVVGVEMYVEVMRCGVQCEIRHFEASGKLFISDSGVGNRYCIDRTDIRPGATYSTPPVNDI